MTAPEFTGDEAHDQATLRAAFPDWLIACVRGQWLASRNLVREDLAGAVQAPTADALYAVLASRRPR
jgi:hypothetical protein